jgi:hypothetical protein
MGVAQFSLVEFTDVSETFAASIIRAMMEAASTSETSVNFYQTTRRNNPEDSHLELLRPRRWLLKFFVGFLGHSNHFMAVS